MGTTQSSRNLKHNSSVKSSQDERSTRRKSSVAKEDSDRTSIGFFRAGSRMLLGPLSATSVRPRGPSLAQSTPLDLKIMKALQELKQQQDKTSSANTFTRIMLNFPSVGRAFQSVEFVFQEYDREHKGYIVYSELDGAMRKLGLVCSPDELRELLEESDMEHKGQLNFKEFLACLTIMFILHRIPSSSDDTINILRLPMSSRSMGRDISAENGEAVHGDNKLRAALELAIDTFLWFDVDGNGVIDKGETALRLADIMSKHSPTKKMSSQRTQPGLTKSGSFDASSMNLAIWEQRFSEMDRDKDGAIHFKDFLLAFESWVGFEDDEEKKESDHDLE